MKRTILFVALTILALAGCGQEQTSPLTDGVLLDQASKEYQEGFLPESSEPARWGHGKAVIATGDLQRAQLVDRVTQFFQAVLCAAEDMQDLTGVYFLQVLDGAALVHQRLELRG